MDLTPASEPAHPHLRLLRDYFSAIEREADEAEHAAFFTPNVQQLEFPNRLIAGGAQRDLAQLLEGSRRGRQAVRHQRYELRNALVHGDRVALELIWTAELRVPLGQTPVGGRLRASCGMFFDFEDGRIARQRNYDCFDAF